MNRLNNITRRTASAMFAALVLTFALSATAAQAQTTAFTYQGKLTDTSSGAPSQYDMRFRLYDTPTVGTGTQAGGDVVYSTAMGNAVNVSNGVFTVTLNFGQSPFAAGANRYLEIAVKRAADTNYTILADRQPITASPYSIRTLSASAADALSTACVSCVTNAQINSVDGAKVTGSVANATNATTATTAGNVTGVVAIANGGTGSSTKNFVDLTTAQTIAGAKTFSGNLRTNGLIRTGSETGTSEQPFMRDSLYSGLVVRRINSINQAAGQVAARTDYLRLERDGSNGGWRIANDSLPPGEHLTVHCFAISYGITTDTQLLAFRFTSINGLPAGTNQIFSNAQNVEYMQCSFGNTITRNQLTQVTLQRFPNDPSWTGTVTSTFNQ